MADATAAPSTYRLTVRVTAGATSKTPPAVEVEAAGDLFAPSVHATVKLGETSVEIRSDAGPPVLDEPGLRRWKAAIDKAVAKLDAEAKGGTP